MWGKDLLTVASLQKDDILALFDQVKELKKAPEKFSRCLAGKTLGMIFRKPSTRTRVSFEVAMYQLGGAGLVFRADELQLCRGETPADTARVLSRYLDALMIRTYEHSEVEDFANSSSIPVINGLTNQFHPCQALTDYFTMWEKFGDLENLKVAYVGDGNNVAHSLMLAGAILGVDVVVACPSGFEPDTSVVAKAADLAFYSGAKIEVVADPTYAVKNANVIYTDVWVSMGQEKQAVARRENLFVPFQVNEKLVQHADANWVFMHCLPAHRGEEVTDEILDSERSVVFDQAENRLHVQKGILLELMKPGRTERNR